MIKKAITFHVLIWYLATLQNSIIASNNFSIESLGYYKHVVVVSVNNDFFLVLFNVHSILLPFLFLIALVWAFSRMFDSVLYLI